MKIESEAEKLGLSLNVPCDICKKDIYIDDYCGDYKVGKHTHLSCWKKELINETLDKVLKWYNEHFEFDWYNEHFEFNDGSLKDYIDKLKSEGE